MNPDNFCGDYLTEAADYPFPCAVRDKLTLKPRLEFPLRPQIRTPPPPIDVLS